MDIDSRNTCMNVQRKIRKRISILNTTAIKTTNNNNKI